MPNPIIVWRLVLLLWLTVVLSVFGSVQTFAQRDLEAAYQRMRALRLAGENEKALPVAEWLEAQVKARSGDQSERYGTVLNALGIIHEKLGHFELSESFHKQALGLFQKGRDPGLLSMSMGNLAVLAFKRGRYAEAEDFYKRAIESDERQPTSRDYAGIPILATDMDNLAYLYEVTGRFSEAKGLYERAIAIQQRAHGPQHVDQVPALGGLARVLLSEGQAEQAEQHAKRALDLQDRAQGGMAPRNMAYTRELLSQVYRTQARYAEAEVLIKQALAIRERLSGADSPDIAETLDELGKLYLRWGQNSKAVEVLTRAYDMRRRLTLDRHPAAATNFTDLSRGYLGLENPREALAFARKASAIAAATRANSSGGARVVDETSRQHLRALFFASQRNEETAPELAREAFGVAQSAAYNSASTALHQMGVRFAAGNSPLSVLVREDQDLRALWQERNKALAEALSGAGERQKQAQLDRIRGEIKEIETKQKTIAARLEAEFPEYAVLSHTRALDVGEVQTLLGPKESLVFFVTDDDFTGAFLVQKDSYIWNWIPKGRTHFETVVARLREGLDVADLQAAIKRGQSQLFSLGEANAAYVDLLGPFGRNLRSTTHLIIVPAGPLTSLPFQLLVTEKPAIPQPTLNQLGAYREAHWLIKAQAITSLPAVSSLKALRALATRAQGQKAMIAFGDPVFDRSATAGALGKTRSYAAYFKGTRPDYGSLRQGLAPLPETAGEVRTVAKHLGATEQDLYLGLAATETAIKRAPLEQYRVIYLATHGLIAGEVQGLAEPTLVFSLPDQPSDIDDGLLTASEVSQLKLNADWVVLSACNTAAGDKPGAEAFSGLAKAFFYAGARAILVSHWRVDSEAATRLTTSTFEALQRDRAIGRAEALRRSMLAYMADRASPWNAYPDYWAPFSVVGEGGTR